jgi:hypothetical protein
MVSAAEVHLLPFPAEGPTRTRCLHVCNEGRFPRQGTGANDADCISKGSCRSICIRWPGANVRKAMRVVPSMDLVAKSGRTVMS